jgi:hypothetical protein
MQVIYTLFDKPHKDHDFDAALRCTQKFAGVPVSVITEFPNHLEWAWATLCEYIPDRMWRTSLWRWLVIHQWMLGREQNGAWPILCLDWDCVVYRDVKSLFEQTKEADVCFTVDDYGNRGQPWIFHRQGPLDAFSGMLLTMLRTRAPALLAPAPGNFQDMGYWEQVTAMCGWRFRIINDLVDHNLSCAEGFEREDGGFENVTWRKKIVYEPGPLPCFFRTDGTVMLPYFIHFWGPLKPLIAEVVKKIGV